VTSSSGMRSSRCGALRRGPSCAGRRQRNATGRVRPRQREPRSRRLGAGLVPHAPAGTLLPRSRS
jgi:hypothetical protein